MLDYAEILNAVDKIRTLANGRDAMLNYLLGMAVRYIEEKADHAGASKESMAA